MRGAILFPTREAMLEPILSLIAPTDREPPVALKKPKQSSPFFQVNSQGFLLRAPSGGRIHYAKGHGIAVSEPEDRPAGDLQPFVLSSGFAAAAWLDGRIPLSANAVQLPDGCLLLIASDREDLHETMALALADITGLPVSDAPVIIDPEDPATVCTNGQQLTLRRTSKDSPHPPVRKDARRLRVDRPAIDGARLHPCAGLVCVSDGKGEPGVLTQISLMHCITEIKKHIFMPLVGNAIWGEKTIGMAHLVLANNLPMGRFSLPTGEKPSAASAQLLLSQLNVLGE